MRFGSWYGVVRYDWIDDGVGLRRSPFIGEFGIRRSRVDGTCQIEFRVNGVRPIRWIDCNANRIVSTYNVCDYNGQIYPVGNACKRQL